MFRVTEIFYSIQGEGATMGRPCVFIRLTNCNLTCDWCDSWKTWRFKDSPAEKSNHVGGKDTVADYEADSKDMSAQEIFDKVMSFGNINRVIITGGEPLYWNKDLPKLLNTFRTEVDIEIETNGTIMPSDAVDSYIERYNVSPKLKNSGNSLKLRENKKVLEFFAERRNTIFKFVTDGGVEDHVEILRFVRRYGILNEKIYLMPEATTEAKLQVLSVPIVEICKIESWNYSSRLQVAIWGEVMGV